MLGNFVKGSWSVNTVWPVGLLVALILLVYFILLKGRKGSVRLEGELIYDIGRSLLKRSIRFEPVEEMVFSIGPSALSDHHIMVDGGSSFKFTVKALRSSSGERLIHIKCDPPGLLKHKGVVKSEADLYNGDELVMNGIPLQYNNGQQLNSGKNILEERVEDGTVDE